MGSAPKTPQGAIVWGTIPQQKWGFSTDSALLMKISSDSMIFTCFIQQNFYPALSNELLSYYKQTTLQLHKLIYSNILCASLFFTITSFVEE